ncbi:MAG: VapB-type antitoxin [Thermoprotei archaeon]|nr:VapB-type antitoxin [Thermoproteales archaeon]RLE87216.1 MAG: VapB-type antitoxin [Thermoprotei archaeon]RLE96836.1 MAG: VapB-type antitoxin [Thermoprotei archaeon]
MSVVISVRVRRELKEELERLGVNIAEEVRRFLEELAWRERVKREVDRINALLESVKPSPEGFAARSVREDRDEGH